MTRAVGQRSALGAGGAARRPGVTVKQKQGLAHDVRWIEAGVLLGRFARVCQAARAAGEALSKAIASSATAGAALQSPERSTNGRSSFYSMLPTHHCALTTVPCRL